MINVKPAFSFFLCIIVFTFFVSVNSIAQQQKNSGKDKMSGQTDLKDLLKDLFGSKKKISDTLIIVNPEDRVAVSILPGVSYNPATSFIVGLSASVTWYFGDLSNTTNSTISSGLSYSLKNQFKLSLQSSIFAKNDDWSFQGDWRFWKYVQNTYGLGTGTPNSNEQNMKFNMIRFNENILKNIFEGAYAGLGYSMEYYSSIESIDEEENPLNPNIHNNYCRLHGIDSTEYLSSGIVLNVNFDSRDNTVNAYKGMMFDAKYYNYNKAIGSVTNWQKIDLEFRAFHSFKKNNSYRIGLWLMGSYVLNGNIPYMSLSSNGWDKYNATARGYVQGRFRGRNMFYGEIENRFNLTKNGLLGLAVFANAISLSNPDNDVKVFEYIEPAGGVGLRIKFDKYARTNISVDYGIGRDDSKGVFLTIGEFF